MVHGHSSYNEDPHKKGYIIHRPIVQINGLVEKKIIGTLRLYFTGKSMVSGQDIPLPSGYLTSPWKDPPIFKFGKPSISIRAMA